MKKISIAVASSFATTLFWSAPCNVVVTANKDESYYANGITNPNVRAKMYWKEGYNVLEDLDQFAALYVTYHNCAWAIPTGGDDDDDNGDGGGDGDDWYLGSVPSFRPNVAYSLYGILQGEKDRGCNKKTFINSFYTTQGVESFTNAMAAAGLNDRFTYVDGDEHDNEGNGDPTSTCYQVDNDSNDNNNQENAEANDDGGGERKRRRLNNGDDYNYVNGAKYDSYAASYGLGCTDRNLSRQAPTFAIQSYSGDYCDANAIVAIKDDLQDFNYRLSETTCVRIYTQGNSGYGGDDEESHDNGDSDSPLALLATSKSCKVYDGSGTCPDPFGKLKHYEVKLSRATGIQGKQSWLTVRQVYIASWTMIGVGILATVIGLCLCCKKCMSRKRRFGAIFRRSSKSRSSTAHRRPIGGSKASSRRSFRRSGSSSGLSTTLNNSNSFSSKASTTKKASSSTSRASRESERKKRRARSKNRSKLLPFFSR